MSERHACRLVGLARSTQRYRSCQAQKDLGLRERLKALAAERMRSTISLISGSMSFRSVWWEMTSQAGYCCAPFATSEFR